MVALERAAEVRFRAADDQSFLPGHKIMVQVQSSRFPLHDRNPHTFVPNIVFVKATQRIAVAGPDRSHVSLPVVK